MILVAILVTLASCATPYQQKSFSGGFSDVQLNDNIFNVSFKGNSSTSIERAVDFSMLRSAEIALTNGYKYFSILESEKYAKEYVHFDRRYRRYYMEEKPRIFFQIECYNEKPEHRYFNALYIYNSVSDKYNLKRSSQYSNNS